MELADLSGPLPKGTSVLEASAGTGKTWTIAGLVARYVAEGRATIDQLLVVTFGRAATSELRNRVRERLQSVHRELEAGSDDPVVTLLRQGDVALHRKRLSTALASFDSATVATTHSFCEQVLRSLGTLADLDPGTVMVEDVDDIIAEVVDDLYLRFSGLGKQLLPFTPEAALRVARAAVYDPEAALLPVGAEHDSEGDLRVRFATKVREEVETRKRRQRLLGFDDQLARVRAALTDSEVGTAACQRLRDRFKVVLVDEFQDTDPVQWDVLHTAFHGHSTLVVIGDPKQAIYAFRGADVGAYLLAKVAAEVTQTLGTNWRSDPHVLSGLAVLLRGAALGDPEIVVSPVGPGYSEVALGPTPDPKPVRLRLIPRAALTKGTRDPGVGAARAACARDAAAQVVELLQEELTFTPRGSKEPRKVDAADVAVIVRTKAQARLVREALLDVAVPCVLTGTESVFATQAARDWVVLLEALEQPHSSGRVRRLALTSLVGLTATELDTSPETVDDLAQRLRSWAEVLADRGVAGLFASVAMHLAERLLRLTDGERLLTDLRHVAEIVHGQAIEAQLGLAGLVAWLRDRVADTDDNDQERSRRLDTDRAAVQVVTVHSSKGLEFPIVLVPFGWDQAGGGNQERLPRGHSAEGGRTLFVGGKNDPGYPQACSGQDREDDGEELRLLYVAMTRAISRLVLWWAPSTKTKGGPLHRLLLCPDPSAVPAEVPMPNDDDLRTQLAALVGGAVALDTVAMVSLVPLPAEPAPPVTLDVARFTSPLDPAWRRTSYSGLTRDAHSGSPAVGSEPDASVKDDEPEQPAETAAGSGSLSLWSDLPAGPVFGTLVHSVLEVADLTVPDVEAELRRCVDEQLALAALDYDASALVAALSLSVSTPLLSSGISLRDIPRRDVLAELDFELPLAGGDAPVREVELREISDLLRQHLLVEDPVHAYAERLEMSGLGHQLLRGYLGGQIDAVLRVEGRHYVVDHKTNRLAPRDVKLTSWHYRRDAMDLAMLEAHYPLQAMLYCVAVHRFLRWRVPAYDPALHLGGVRYLFLRGMCGPGVDAGVWAWDPPADLVVALSDLLAGVVHV